MLAKRASSSFASYALPFLGFLLAGTWGLAQVVQSKRDLQVPLMYPGVGARALLKVQV